MPPMKFAQYTTTPQFRYGGTNSQPPQHLSNLGRKSGQKKKQRKTIAHHTSSSYASAEPLLVALGMFATASPSLDLQSEEWEVLCRDAGGWEYVDGCIGKPMEGDEKGKVPTNEFGEKMGLARLKEMLEANEWEGKDGGGLGDVLDEDEGLDDGLALEEDLDEVDKTDVEGDTGELKERLLKVDAVKGQAGRTENEVDEYGGEDDDARALESMMLKMQAVRDMGADMPEMERKKFAAKAVREVMKTL
ncbi:MAG: hypothetical protein Q9164_000285 [Protoblastenia rupestris]